MRIPFLTALLLASLALVPAAQGSPGDLDTAFGGDGMVTSDFGGQDEWAVGVAVQPDGKVVSAGYTSEQGLMLVRHDIDGSLDGNFGSSGRALTTSFGSTAVTGDLALQADGKIVVTGTIADADGQQIIVARYEADGDLDTTFGTGGTTVTDLGDNDSGNAVVIQPDGKIVVAAQTGQGELTDTALARYGADGTPDPTFGGDGTVVIDLAPTDSASDLAVQADGKLATAGVAGDNGSWDFAVARYHADGSLDTSFGGDGHVTTDLSAEDAQAEDGASKVAVQPDGRIVAAGCSGDADVALVRYDTDGGLDSGFGGDGKVLDDLGGYDCAAALALQADGKLVVAGARQADDGGSGEFALARYGADGGADTSFGTGGHVFTDFGPGIEGASDVAIESGGAIVAAGFTDPGPGGLFGEPFDFALARYLP